MKNQNDLIISAVAGFIGIVLFVVFFATAPQVTQPAAPTDVPVATPTLPAGDVQFANALPGASSSSGPSGAMGGGPMGGGRRGMGGGMMGGGPGGRLGGGHGPGMAGPPPR